MNKYSNVYITISGFKKTLEEIKQYFYITKGKVFFFKQFQNTKPKSGFIFQMETEVTFPLFFKCARINCSPILSQISIRKQETFKFESSGGGVSFFFFFDKLEHGI